LGIFSQLWGGFSRYGLRKKQKTSPNHKHALDLSKLPKHIGIIMDGNGRWAGNRGLPRTAGHQEGLARVREIIAECGALGIQTLTLFVFSTENWKRPQEEVSFLMNLFYRVLQEEVDEMHKQRVRVRFIGEKDKLKPELVNLLRKLEKQTADNSGLNLNIALNYGSRKEILSAVRRLAQDFSVAKINQVDLDEKLFAEYLYTAGQPDPELIIRTSGEERLSNFLLWQAAYAEFVFVRTLWPDFDSHEFHKALDEFQNRKRRFGAVT